jgi:hypothetical protein
MYSLDMRHGITDCLDKVLKNIPSPKWYKTSHPTHTLVTMLTELSWLEVIAKHFSYVKQSRRIIILPHVSTYL